MSAPDYWNLLDARALQACLEKAGNRRIVIAVSGGADSMALLLSLHSLTSRLGLNLIIAHYNHQTRAGCAEDQSFVEGIANRLGISIQVGIAEGHVKPGGISPEEFWRQQRYRFFAQVVKESGSSFLALGHTADDLAETFLYHLARGSSPSRNQFQFSRRCDEFTILRPLWKTSRGKIEQALVSAGQSWRNDPSNIDPRFSRNLIRHQVIPALEKINPRVSEAIVRFSELLPEIQTESSMPWLVRNNLNLEDSRELYEILAAFIRFHSHSRPSRSQLDQICQILHSGKTGLVSLYGKTTVVLDQKDIWIYRGDQPTDRDLAIQYALDRGLRLAHLAEPVDISVNSLTLAGFTGDILLEQSDFEKFENATHIRNRQNRDIYSGRILKKVLIDEKIPWFIRDYLLMLVSPQGAVVGWLT